MAGGFQPLQQGLPLVVAHYRSVADHGESLADVHQYIRVIDRHPVPVDRVERDHVVVHALCEVAEHVQVGTRRQTGIGNAIHPVQDHAARAFEKMTVRFMVRQVDDLPHLEAQLRVEMVDDVHAPLAPAVLCFHRIKHDRAVRVKADPVIGKYGVRRVGLARVIEYNDIDPCTAQSRDEPLEFRQCRALLLGRRRVGFRLEGIGIRRLRIALEARRPDHRVCLHQVCAELAPRGDRIQARRFPADLHMTNETMATRIRAALSNPGWVCLTWFGMTAGVSLLAVPAQFAASAATRAVSLDVARTIFTTLNKAELVALVLLLIVVRVSGNARKWWAACSVLAFVILLQTVWLLPELADRAGMILSGTEPPPSIAHAAYSTLELAKLGILLILGLAAISRPATQLP